MYIGKLKCKENLSFTHVNSDVPFPPTTEKAETFTWSWNEIFDTGVDISLELEQICYIGAVFFKAADSCIDQVTVLVDGKAAGSVDSSKEALIGGDITVPVGVYGHSVTLRIFADFQNIEIGGIEILGAFDDETPLIWPTPESVSRPIGRAKIARVIPATDDSDEIFAATFLSESLYEKLGIKNSDKGITVIIKKDSYDGERYTVKNCGNTVVVSAAKRISLLYGVNALLSLTNSDGLLLSDVDDNPYSKLRGFHFGLPHRDKIEFTKRLLRYVLLPMRYNVIFLEFAGGMRFERHPEISEGWLSAAENAKAGKQPFMPHSDKVSRYSLLEKDDVKLLVLYIKELGFALIPEVQSLAHVQYITYAHPEIAELDNSVVEVDVREGADARPESFYAHSYCPSNKKSYEIIYDIIDEIVEVTEPDEYVHIGHDEVYQIGLCDKCKGKNPAELFTNHVTALYDYLSKKGLKTMMWSDMLHPAPVTDYLTYKAVEKLPRDIVMLDFIWYFHPEREIEDDLLPYGYKVCVGNLYSSHYKHPATRLRKKGMIGGEISSWLITDENILARNGKLWDILYLSEILWNTNGYDERNRKSYNEIISKRIQPTLRDALRGKIQPNGYLETKLDIQGSNEGLPKELIDIFSEAKLAENVDIKVSGTYDRLIFEQATLNKAPRIVWKDNLPVGRYIIEYDDGDAASADIFYGDSVMCYKGGYAIPKHQQYYRHFGYVGTWFSDPIRERKDNDGFDVCTLGFVWENPHPDKKIRKISYLKDRNDYCHLVLFGIKGLKAK